MRSAGQLAAPRCNSPRMHLCRCRQHCPLGGMCCSTRSYTPSSPVPLTWRPLTGGASGAAPTLSSTRRMPSTVAIAPPNTPTCELADQSGQTCLRKEQGRAPTEAFAEPSARPAPVQRLLHHHRHALAVQDLTPGTSRKLGAPGMQAFSRADWQPAGRDGHGQAGLSGREAARGTAVGIPAAQKN